MKPWFEKEAKIIPFPKKPERQVIKMPSVSEYPDFITGVQDLQAREKKGQISKDTYDRLYADLIKRFMKKESFDTPWFLREEKLKPLPFKSTRGDINEPLFAGAITTRFMKYPEPIKESDVKDTINAIRQENSLQKQFTHDNGIDKIDYIIKMPSEINRKDFADKDLFDNMATELKVDTTFVNSDRYTQKVAKLLSDNDRPDRIQVISSGPEGQKESKVDVELVYIKPNGEERRLKGISLKTGGDLYGQTSPNPKIPKNFAAHKAWWERLGVKINDYTFEDYMENSLELVKNTFKMAKNQISAQLQGDNNQKEKLFLNNVIKFLDFAVALNDKKLEVLDIKGGKYSVQTVKRLAKNLPNVDLSVGTLVNVHGVGQIIIKGTTKDNENIELFRIRHTYSEARVNKAGKKRPARHRIFVVPGPLMTSLATVSKG